MMRRWLGLCGACVLGLIVVSAAQANLIVNGSFEQPGGLTGPNLTKTYTTGQDVGGWKVVGPSVVLVEGTYKEAPYGIAAFQANHGSYSLDLTGPGNQGLLCGVEQSVTTVVGQLYDLSFYVGRAVSGPGVPPLFYTNPASVDLSINNGARVRFTNSDSSPGGLNWKQFSTSFVADSTSTVISFYNGSLNTAEVGLDNVSMVPEPASIALLGIGGIALFYAARRRRRS